MDQQAQSVLLDIARCPNVSECLQGTGSDHPCRRIVMTQGSRTIDQHQIPEPWSGRLAEAPLLFLGSNPSIDESESYPRWSSLKEQLISYFNERFENSIQDGRKARREDGVYGKSVQTWTEVRGRAMELYETENVIPGIHYALSEVVHCKSRKNLGVAEAINECTSRYLDRVLSCSPAKIIVALGRHSAGAMVKQYGVDSARRVQGPVRVAGRDRFVVFLAQPGSNQARKFATVASPDELKHLRVALRS